MFTTCWPQARLRLPEASPSSRSLLGAASLEYVPGRFQSVDCGQDFAVVVDYAHTDDALRNIIGSRARS